MSTRQFGCLLCKNCGTLCIFQLKSAKTYRNRSKNSKITRRSTIFKVFRRYFYVFTLRYASLSCLSIRVTYCFSLLSKEVGKTAPDGIRILLVTLCPEKSHAADIERGFEPDNILNNSTICAILYMVSTQCSCPVTSRW